MAAFFGKAGSLFLWILLLMGQSPSRLTTDGDWKGHVRVSPDGSTLHFTRILTMGTKSPQMELAVMPLSRKDSGGLGSGGPAVALLKPNPGIPQFDAHLHPDGAKIVYVHDILEGTDGKLHIHTANSDGTGTKIAIPYVAFEESPRWSPDHPDADNQGWWSPDGKEIVFVSYREGGARLFKMRADGSGVKRLVPPRPGQGNESWPVWSPKGDRIAFACLVGGQSEIFTVKPDASDLRRITNNLAQDTFPAWAPDGKTLLFCSSRDGGTDVYAVKVD